MMNSRPLPAGQQNMQQDMGRRRPYNQNHNPQYPPAAPMYNGYMQQYQPVNYYQQQQYAPQYHNPMPHPYAQYPPYVRSPPPPMQHYAHPPLPQQPYPRPQQSPAALAPASQPPPQTPPSTLSSHTAPAPAPITPPTPPVATSLAPTSSPREPPLRPPFRAPLPWLSRPDLSWPARRARRKKKPSRLSVEDVELPEQQGPSTEIPESNSAETPGPRPETPSTSHPASEANNSTNPTTPSSVQPSSTAAHGETTPVISKLINRSTATLPAVPILHAIPKTLPKDLPKASSDKNVERTEEKKVASSEEDKTKAESAPSQEIEPGVSEAIDSPVNAWSKPKLWAGLFNPATASLQSANNSGQDSAVQSFGKSSAETRAEAFRSFDALSNDSKVAFLEPRGLINTGNMCYMNSVLQVLVFCTPFYNFLDQVGKRAAHSFKSDTPLIEAMIMFMREYSVIDSATSVEQLRLRLKEGELEQYGEAFTPDFVYDVIKRLPRFVTMRRGHQQDAEEFLGFLLEGLHDECVLAMGANSSNATSAMATPTNGPASPISDTSSIPGSISMKENGWLEVGPKQKASVTRSSGSITNSPLSKIFGGNLRSELRVPGLKDSVTLEPYQPLQLDIGAPNVNNIIDALKGLTRSEILHGDFKSPKGPDVSATKQVFIETLPPVLILHLKRFQYDNTGGTQKIWKKVGYPLELEIPKEVFPRQKRTQFALGGLPKYRLIAVVYHHGKNASGGHYTVDVRRQDGREWVRLDDTIIRRVRSEDVAEGGSEEDPKVIAAALEGIKKDSPSSGNAFSAIDEDQDDNENDGWKQASGQGKKWSNVVNGASTPKSKNEKSSIKDNKVAYLLFYQKI